ncbi:MAG TPA: efflux RND transporter periplasmic adaptor subunit [Phycisphaerae bacterium]|nr:efflux RND transporter periplasmic adaptor subunit [Phycisphaerae bacterium]
MRKAVIIVLVVVAVAGVIGWRVHAALVRQQGPGRGRGARAVPVEAQLIGRRTVRDVAEFTGTLLPRSQFIVAPKVSGRLEKLQANIGDAIRNGDLIAVLDSAEYVQQEAQARAELEVARASLAESRSALDVAARELKRVQELREQKVASESELDEADARHRAAEARYEVVQAQIKREEAARQAAQARLDYTRIHVSWEDGNDPRAVAERFVDEGAMLRANDPIISVVDISSVLAVIHVIERDYPDIRIGQTVTVTTDAYEGREFTGRIVRRAPVFKEESRQARVEVDMPNPQGLLAPGMYVRARIEFAKRENATVVPASAILTRDGRRGVFLVDSQNRKAKFVPLEIGIVEGDWAEVLQPPLDGMVVTLGHHLLSEGVSVVVTQTASAPTAESAPSSGPATQGLGGQEGRP